MKISISTTGGTFRLIELASELNKMDYLDSLFIPFYSKKYPYLTRLFGKHNDVLSIDGNKVKTNLTFLFISKIRSYRRFRNRNSRSFLLSEMYDKWVARKLSQEQYNTSNIIMAESIIALHTLTEAKKLGLITILDTTNSHISNQTEILEDEYNRLGINYTFNPPHIIEKGVQEYNEADYIVVRSSYVKKTFLERHIPQEKLFIVPSGINLDNFSQITKEDKIFRVIYCGLSCIKKGTHYLLQAYSDLKLKNAELWLIGNISEDIKAILGKYKDIYKVIKFIPRTDLYKYYSQGSIFVLPSLEEGLAKVMMEAMACGLPVIATSNSGAEDVIRDGRDGFIIPIKDVGALKDRILYMYENYNVCLEMGQSAKERINDDFTLDAYGKRMVDTLKIISSQDTKNIRSSIIKNAV